MEANNITEVEATPEYRFDLPEGTTVFEDLFLTRLENRSELAMQ